MGAFSPVGLAAGGGPAGAGAGAPADAAAAAAAFDAIAARIAADGMRWCSPNDILNLLPDMVLFFPAPCK